MSSGSAHGAACSTNFEPRTRVSSRDLAASFHAGNSGYPSTEAIERRGIVRIAVEKRPARIFLADLFRADHGPLNFTPEAVKY
jgi:hypothetical protein